MDEWVAVKSRGFVWHVNRSGDVRTPAHDHEYTRVRNGVTQTLTASFKERAIAPCVTKNGYLEVSAKKQGKRIKEFTHRLVGMAFVPGYQEGLTINHIDGVKTNNAPENLEWVSLARNTQHEWESGLVDLRGERQPGSKLTSKRVVYIRRLLAQGVSAHTLAVVAGVSSSLVEKIRDGKLWAEVTHGKPVVAA